MPSQPGRPRSLHSWTAPLFRHHIHAAALVVAVCSPTATAHADPAVTATWSGQTVSEPVAADCGPTPAAQRICQCGAALWAEIEARYPGDPGAREKTLYFKKTLEPPVSFVGSVEGKRDFCTAYANLLGAELLVRADDAVAKAALGAVGNPSQGQALPAGTDAAGAAALGKATSGAIQRAVAAQTSPLPDDAPGTQGGNAATAVAPSIVPVQLAAQSASIGYGRQGAQLQLHAAVNPLGALAGQSPKDAYWLSRLWNLSLDAPINLQNLMSAAGTGGAAGGGSTLTWWNILGDVSLRTSINFLAFHGRPKEAMGQLLHEVGTRLASATALLSKALHDPAIPLPASGDSAALSALALRLSTENIEAELRTRLSALELEMARRERHTGYFGLDLRVDAGDPTASGKADLVGITPLSALAGGYSFHGDRTNVGARARLGWQGFYGTEVPGAAFLHSLDWSAALAVGWSASFYLNGVGRAQAIEITAGVDGKHALNTPSPLATAYGQTNTLMVKANISVPLTTGSSLGLGVALPIWGNGPAMVTLSGNLAQLLGAPPEIPLSGLHVQ